MKRILFVTQSRLSQNLLGIIIKSIPRKIDYLTFSSLDEINATSLKKPVHLVIIDLNVFEGLAPTPKALAVFEGRTLKKARKLIIHDRQAAMDHRQLKTLGIDQGMSKPFLPEELVTLIMKSVGDKK